MAGIIAPGVCRFTVNGTYSGRPVANIIDMFIDNIGVGTSRQDAIEDQAAIIVSAWADEICERLVAQYSANSVSWVDLNSSTGTTGETSNGTGTNFPKVGEQAVAGLPGNVALRVLKSITAARGQRQGRMYIVGAPETETATATPNTVLAASVTAWNAKLATFLSAIDQNSGVSGAVYDSAMSVVHTANPDPSDPTSQPVWVATSDIQDLTMDPTLATQRRRLRG